MARKDQTSTESTTSDVSTSSTTGSPSALHTKLEKIKAGARKVAEFGAKWCGMSPHDLDETLDNGNMEAVDIASLIDQEITITGYLPKSGKDGVFVVMSVVTDDNVPFVVVTGAGVIVRKLQEVNEAGGFPVQGTIQKRKAKDSKFFYFDFI
jgi:hypothetical protein